MSLTLTTRNNVMMMMMVRVLYLTWLTTHSFTPFLMSIPPRLVLAVVHALFPWKSEKNLQIMFHRRFLLLLNAHQEQIARLITSSQPFRYSYSVLQYYRDETQRVNPKAFKAYCKWWDEDQLLFCCIARGHEFSCRLCKYLKTESGFNVVTKTFMPFSLNFTWHSV